MSFSFSNLSLFTLGSELQVDRVFCYEYITTILSYFFLQSILFVLQTVSYLEVPVDCVNNDHNLFSFSNRFVVVDS